MKRDFLYHQPKWKGRKIVRRFVAALAIGSLSLSLHYVYKKTDQGWTRDTVISRKDSKGPREQFVSVTTVFLLNGTTTWIVPADFLSLVSVECLGAGSSANSQTTSAARASGSAAAYAKITSTSTTLTPGVTSINVGVGLGGASVTGAVASNAGGDTWWNATSLANAVTNGSAVSCAAEGGKAAASGVAGAAGAAANSVGTTKFSGGIGNAANTISGGGGAAGPAGAGTAGNTSSGGAANNSTTAGPTSPHIGNSGTEFDASHGCGTGAWTNSGTGFAGGLYGGGGCCSTVANPSGPGADGLLVIVYTPANATPYNPWLQRGPILAS